jgi:NAD(P)-dependent dehydrogenase (short-subunit alcohol dehydrogenase family)
MRYTAAFALLLTSALLATTPAYADTVLITGANSGIGLEFAKEYAAKGWTVIATHRRSEPPKSLTDLAAKYDKVRIEKLDVTDQQQANALAARLSSVPIDVLINNAGVYNDRSKCRADDEACAGDWGVEGFGNLNYPLLDTIMAVNIKGPLIVSEPQPRPGAIFYRASKAALNREMQIVAASTRKDGVTVVMLNPGPTLTEHQEYLEGKFQGMLKTSFTVENMIKTIDKVTLADTGRFLRYDGVTEPW